MAGSWTENEVDAIVKDYFDMLMYELQEIAFNKSEHRRTLSKQLNNRTNGSIERKHQNISAVLIELGMPYISGYKPLKNYQRSLLPDAILEHLTTHPNVSAIVSEDVASTVEVPSFEDILSALTTPPEPRFKRSEQVSEPSTEYMPRPVNYLAREASNQALGNAGEQFIINFERARLTSLGKASLADQIEHVSVSKGDGAGFDIRSYEENGTDRFIEAKTTKYGKNIPFFVSANELKFSEENQDAYYLYRVFQFRRNPQLFMLPGFIETHCSLSPTEYIARL